MCFSYLDLPFVCKICAFLPKQHPSQKGRHFYIFGRSRYVSESKSMAHPSNSLANEGLGWDSLLQNILSSWWFSLESCVAPPIKHGWLFGFMDQIIEPPKYSKQAIFLNRCWMKQAIFSCNVKIWVHHPIFDSQPF